MKAKHLFIFVFVIGVVTSHLASSVMVNAEERPKLPELQDIKPVEGYSPYDHKSSEELFLAEIAFLSEDINRRLDNEEEAMAQMNGNSKELSSVSSQETDLIDNKETLGQAMKINTMAGVLSYVDSQIETGRWTRENSDFLRSVSRNLTNEQLIELQITLSKAVNNNQLTLETDSDSSPLF